MNDYVILKVQTDKRLFSLILFLFRLNTLFKILFYLCLDFI